MVSRLQVPIVYSFSLHIFIKHKGYPTDPILKELALGYHLLNYFVLYIVWGARDKDK